MFSVSQVSSERLFCYLGNVASNERQISTEQLVGGTKVVGPLGDDYQSSLAVSGLRFPGVFSVL